MSHDHSQIDGQAGFSLAETVIALMIFSLAASVLLPNALSSAQRINKDAQAIDEELQVHNALTAHLLGLDDDEHDSGLEIVTRAKVNEGTQLHLRFYEAEQQGETRALAAQIEPAS